MPGQNLAGFEMEMDGAAPPAELLRRLSTLRLTEKRGDEADQLDITLFAGPLPSEDVNGVATGPLRIPPEGAIITLRLGWLAGPDVEHRLIDKGRFRVDEVELSGPPDQVAIRARAADLTAGFRVRREASHIGTTLGAIVRDISRRNGLQPAIAAALASVPVAAIGQDGESDMAFIRRLGRMHDAVATVKAGRLLFLPIGAGRSAGGQPLPGPAIIQRSDGDRFTWTRAAREDYRGVEARWQDQDRGERRTVSTARPATGSPERPARRLRRVYASEAEARRAAEAEEGRIQRGLASLSLTLALGRPDLFADRRVQAEGFHPSIDGAGWLVADATHTLDARGGLTTQLKLETAEL